MFLCLLFVGQNQCQEGFSVENFNHQLFIDPHAGIEPMPLGVKPVECPDT